MFPITFITGNENKWQEALTILGPNCNLVRQNIELTEVQGSIETIAISKCKEACKQINGPVIVEDTALCFDAMKELPGPYIKWFLEALGHDGLIKMLDGFGEKGARAICTIAFCNGPGDEPILFQGITNGQIVSARGPLESFGWDPIFQPIHPSNKTYAEMEKSVKCSISHRFRAFEKLQKHLAKEENWKR